MKKILLTGVASVISISAFPQTAQTETPGFWNDPFLPFYLVAAAVAVLMVLVMAVAIYVINILNFLSREASRQQAAETSTPYTEPVSWWKIFIQKMNASVPVEHEKDIELEHSYDGIRELDNHLPPWWKWLFYGSIAFAVLYMFLFHVSGSLPLSLEEYEHELAMAEQKVKAYQASRPKAVIDEATLEYTADLAIIEKGKLVFTNNNCAGCHRPDGGGNTIGPNLTDDYWLHGGTIRNVFTTIKDGVVEKGMPAWGKSMSAEDVRDVTFFVMSLRGTNPPDAKAPQGELVKQQTEIKTDSLKKQAGL